MSQWRSKVPRLTARFQRARLEPSARTSKEQAPPLPRIQRPTSCHGKADNDIGAQRSRSASLSSANHYATTPWADFNEQRLSVLPLQ